MDIKELAKKLCDESGCHHKCKEIDECVVMEEAEELLINQDKSNNFDVKSNEELFKQALVEGVNNHIDKTIEEEKQIEEMAKDLAKHSFFYNGGCLMNYSNTAKLLYNAGYRKQSEGEWIKTETNYTCSRCSFNVISWSGEYDGYECERGISLMNFCPNCGSKMKGGE